MRRYGLAVLIAGAMALASGCGGGDSGIQVEKLPSSSRTTAAPETQRQEQESEQKQESSSLSPEELLEAAAESIEAAESSIAEAEESLAERESSLAAWEESLLAESESEEENTTEAEQELSYEKLLEVPDAYLGRELDFYGRVIQAVAVDDAKMQLLLAVDEDNATRMVAEYAKDLTSEELEHGDVVAVTGEFLGVLRYRMGSGEVVELPTLRLSVLGMMKKADPLLNQTGEAETEAPGVDGDFSVGTAPGEVDESASIQAPGEAEASAGTEGPGEAETSEEIPENGGEETEAGESDPGQESGSGESAGETSPEAETEAGSAAENETETSAPETETNP